MCMFKSCGLMFLCVAAFAASAAADTAAPRAGGYVGAFAGYGGIDAIARDYDPTFEQPYSASGWLAGAQAGYDWQSERLVFGVVADAAFDSVRGSDISGGPVIFKVRQEWEASLRGRLGYSVGAAVPYVTAGVAFAHFETKYSQVMLPFFVTDADRTGWTVGGGVEIPLGDRVSVVGEYRYSDYGKDGSQLTSPDGPYSLTTDRATVGLNYRF